MRIHGRGKSNLFVNSSYVNDNFDFFFVVSPTEKEHYFRTPMEFAGERYVRTYAYTPTYDIL